MIAYMFAGQGVQRKGMGIDLFPQYQDIVKQADKVLGYSIEELCLDNPERKLNSTEYAQVAIYVVNALIYCDHISRTKIKPDYLIGHSLGEYNALLAAGAFGFEDGLSLVKKRAELMSHAKDGGMAAILEVTVEEINVILANHKEYDIQIANYNEKYQTVISGNKNDINSIKNYFTEINAKFIPLNVSGAFHSKFMETSKNEFKKYVENMSFEKLSTPVISNVTAREYQEEIAEYLVDQMVSPVRWNDTIDFLLSIGCSEFVEMGGYNVLSRFVNSIKMI